MDKEGHYIWGRDQIHALCMKHVCRGPLPFRHHQRSLSNLEL